MTPPAMSAVDIKVCVEELQKLVNGKINKIYHSGDEIRIKVHAGERYDLMIEAGRRIHLTKYVREIRFPSSFAMLLRKHLEGGRIRKIKQYDFDRIVVIEIERGDKNSLLIGEFFSKGNVILAYEDYRVIMALKRLRPNQNYPFPEIKVNPGNILENFRSIIDTSEIVRSLATKGGLGGLFAEEICLRAGVNKQKPADYLNEEEIESVEKAIRETFSPIFEGDTKPHIVSQNGEELDVLPLELEYYSQYDKEYFDTFNEALDEFYSRQLTGTELEESAEMHRLKKRLEKQEEAKQDFETEIEYYKKAGDAFYENYQTIEQVMNAFREAREQISWDEIKKTVKEKQDENGLISIIESVIPKENKVIINIDDLRLELPLDKTIPQIADEYYQKSKKIKSKLDGLLKAMEKTKKSMESEDTTVKTYTDSPMRAVRKREWYERFRWLITSENFLVIGGRSASMNSEIVSKYMENNDLFFHTQSPGAPATVLKNGQEAGEDSLYEAAQFAATYSALWREGKYSGSAYYVKPAQVKRSAKSGEYLAKGSFLIEGKRNYMDVPVSCAIGVEIKNLRVLGGPLSAVKNYCDYIVELDIGDKSHNEISVEIAAKFMEKAREEEKHIVKSISKPDEIMKFLPPGGSRIKE
ncbi:MAG: ribosome rescue protein RqcH [Archaeoglobaceae archaeon]